MAFQIEGTGFILRKAQYNEDDIAWLYSCLKDFPTGSWGSRQRVRAWVDMCEAISDDIFKQNPIPPFKFLTMLYIDPADGLRKGCFICDYEHTHYDATQTFMYTHYAAIHPDHRAQGHFSKMEAAGQWFGNQWLQAEEGFYRVIPDAPQILSRATTRNSRIAPVQRPIFEEGKDPVLVIDTHVILKRDEVADSFTAEEKNMGKVLVNGDKVNKIPKAVKPKKDSFPNMGGEFDNIGIDVPIFVPGHQPVSPVGLEVKGVLAPPLTTQDLNQQLE